jgi:hypothetical protein
MYLRRHRQDHFRTPSEGTSDMRGLGSAAVADKLLLQKGFPLATSLVTNFWITG